MRKRVEETLDQRRVPLTSAPAGTGAYTVSLPADEGVVLPGTYMLFALGTPWVSRGCPAPPAASPSPTPRRDDGRTA